MVNWAFLLLTVGGIRLALENLNKSDFNQNTFFMFNFFSKFVGLLLLLLNILLEIIKLGLKWNVADKFLDTNVIHFVMKIALRIS